MSPTSLTRDHPPKNMQTDYLHCDNIESIIPNKFLYIVLVTPIWWGMGRPYMEIKPETRNTASADTIKMDLFELS